MPAVEKVPLQVNQESPRASILANLVHQLPESFLKDVLEFTRELPELEHSISTQGVIKSDVLRIIALRFCELGRPDDALKVALEINNRSERENLIVELLSKAIKPKDTKTLYGVAISMKSLANRSVVLGKLIPLLDNPLRQQVLTDALTEAREIKDHSTKAEVLQRLALLLDNPLRQQVLSDALTEAREIKDHSTKAEVLQRLALLLDNRLRQHVLSDALIEAREIKDHSTKAEALQGLALLLDNPLCKQVLGEALEAAKQIEANWKRAQIQTMIASKYAGPSLAEAMNFALEVLRDSQKDKMRLDVKFGYMNEGSLSNLLSDLETPWHEWIEYDHGSSINAFNNLLRYLGSQSRFETISAIAAIRTIIFQVVNSNIVLDLYQTIQEVGRWWP
jgi:hypothetical protein